MLESEGFFKNNKSQRALHAHDAEHVHLAPAAAKLIGKVGPVEGC